MSVGRILKEAALHPYKVSLNQELHGDDFQRRQEFCEWMQGRLAARPAFQQEILWSDESTFSNEGSVNRRNDHFYAGENPHWMREGHVQGRYAF